MRVDGLWVCGGSLHPMQTMPGSDAGASLALGLEALVDVASTINNAAMLVLVIVILSSRKTLADMTMIGTIPIGSST